jgi:hypothetical protein
MAGCRGFAGPFPLPLSMSRHKRTQPSQHVHIAPTIRDGTVHAPGARRVGSGLGRARSGRRARDDGCVEGWRVRRTLNAVNGSTLLGLTLATAGGATRTAGPRGLVLAAGYRWSLPRAPVFAVGNVVVSRHDTGWLADHPRLLAHEERHTWQYAACLGLPMIPLYLLAAGYSYLRGGDPAVHNGFERLAGLEDGGYPVLSARELRRRQTA